MGGFTPLPAESTAWAASPVEAKQLSAICKYFIGSPNDRYRQTTPFVECSPDHGRYYLTATVADNPTLGVRPGTLACIDSLVLALLRRVQLLFGLALFIDVSPT